MTRLHKISKFPLIFKYYLTFAFLIFFGIYKNGLIPYFNGYSSLSKIFLLLLFPLISFVLGALIDKFSKNNELFNCKFLSILILLDIPISTNIFIWLGYIILILTVFSFIILKKTKNKINFVVIGQLVFCLILSMFKSLNYQNSLESSGLFQYNFLDIILGHQVSGIYTSSVVIILISFFLLFWDDYYKKEIPLISYSFYLISLIGYGIMKQDLAFIIVKSISPSVLFCLIFVAPLSIYSPYLKVGRIFYSIFMGIIILPISLIFNFYQGPYLAIIFVNIFINLFNLIFKKNKLLK